MEIGNYAHKHYEHSLNFDDVTIDDTFRLYSKRFVSLNFPPLISRFI